MLGATILWKYFLSISKVEGSHAKLKIALLWEATPFLTVSIERFAAKLLGSYKADIKIGVNSGISYFSVFCFYPFFY